MVFDWIIIFFILLIVLSITIVTKEVTGGTQSDINLYEFIKDNIDYIKKHNIIDESDKGIICYAGVTDYYITVDIRKSTLNVKYAPPLFNNILKGTTPVEIVYFQQKNKYVGSNLEKIIVYINNLQIYTNSLIAKRPNVKLQNCGDELKLFTYRYNCQPDSWINEFVKLYKNSTNMLDKIAYIVHFSSKIIYYIAPCVDKSSKFSKLYILIKSFMRFIASILKINNMKYTYDYGMPFFKTQLLENNTTILNYIITATRHLCVLHLDFVKNSIITYNEAHKNFINKIFGKLFVEEIFAIYSRYYQTINYHICGKNTLFNNYLKPKNKLLNVDDEIIFYFGVNQRGDIIDCASNVRRLIILFGVIPNDAYLKKYIEFYYGKDELEKYKRNIFRDYSFMEFFSKIPYSRLIKCVKCSLMHEYNLLYSQIKEVGSKACDGNFLQKYSINIKHIDDRIHQIICSVYRKTKFSSIKFNVMEEKLQYSKFDFVDGYLLFLIFLYYEKNDLHRSNINKRI